MRMYLLGVNTKQISWNVPTNNHILFDLYPMEYY